MKKMLFVVLMVLCSASFGAGVITCEEGCNQKLTGDQLDKCLEDCQRGLENSPTYLPFNNPAHDWQPTPQRNKFIVEPQEAQAPEYRLR